MPEAGRTPTAQFERGDNNLAYGEAGAANSLVGLAAPVREPEPYAPAGDEEEFLYSQTERPAEPMTTGVPVGPGADFTRHAIEDEDTFRQRVAGQLATSSTREARALGERLRQGL